MDLHLPGLSGVDAIPQITPLAAVLVLTVSDAIRALLGAIRAGASAYLVKNAEPSGQGARSPDVIRQVLHAARGAHAEDLPPLSEREEQVVTLIAQGESNRTIADLLGINQHTVKTYVHRIFEKLGVRSRVDVALRARDPHRD